MTKTKIFVFAAALTATTFSSCTKEQMKPEMTASKTTTAGKNDPPPPNNIKLSLIETGLDSPMPHGGDETIGKQADFGLVPFAQVVGTNFTVDSLNVGAFYTCPITGTYAFKVSTTYNRTFCNRINQWFYANFKIVDKNTGTILAQQMHYVSAGYCAVVTYDSGFSWTTATLNLAAGQQVQLVINIPINTWCGTNATSLQSLRFEETL